MPVADQPDVLCASPAALAAFSRVLGFRKRTSDPDAWRISSLEVIGTDRVRLGLKTGTRGCVIHLRPLTVPEAYARTPHMALLYEGTSLEPGVGHLLESLRKRLAGLSLADIRRMTGLSLTVRREPAPEPCACSSTHASFFERLSARRAKDPEAWRQFVIPEREYSFASMISPAVIIGHSDLECRTILHIGAHPVSLYNEPIPECPSQVPDNVLLYTDLRDKDVSQGPNAALTQLLRQLKDYCPKPPRLIAVLGGCLPEVVGEDAGLAIRRAAPSHSGPIISLGAAENGARGILRQLFRVQKRGSRRLRHAVDFVGFPKTAAFMDLVRMLGGMGIKTNSIVVPFFDGPSLRRFGQGRVQIFMKGNAWLQTKDFRSVCPEARGLRRTLAAPYGVAGTRAWLRTIAGLFGRAEEMDEIWRRRQEDFSAEWLALREECRQHTLGFIVDDGSLSQLLSPVGLNGVPILPMVAEMGFRVLFLRYTRPGDESPRIVAPQPCRAFSSREQLDRLLRASAVSAVYSDIGFDRRILRAGKAQFSTKEAEMGPRGALRWGHAILAACRTSFFREYREWLEVG